MNRGRVEPIEKAIEDGTLEEASTFDYIIVGGGPAGCALASRLAEDERHSVLLVEAGSESHPDARMPAGGASLFAPPTAYPLISTPQAGLNDRTIPLAHAKLLGGSTNLNGTLVVKSLKSDFDAWDISGWGGDEVFECMRRAEGFRKVEWFEEDEGAHGYDGMWELTLAGFHSLQEPATGAAAMGTMSKKLGR